MGGSDRVAVSIDAVYMTRFVKWINVLYTLTVAL